MSYLLRLSTHAACSLRCNGPPQVPYLLDLGEGPAAAVEISRASDFPINRRVRAVLEPTVKATIVTPQRYVGKVMQLCLQV